MKRIVGIILSVVLIFSMLLTNVGVVEASTSRVAIISKLEGTVEVQKSGGKRTLKGFKNMSLNEGDIVSTGSKSSAVLKFSNGTSEDDTLTLESNTVVTFSKLSNKNGTTTKVKMKKGKAWVDVKSIKNANDDFKLETPTAIMGVRGTNFFVGVDPNTGQSVIGLFSGRVDFSTSQDNFQSTGHMLPTQLVFFDPASGELVGGMSNQSIEQMLGNSSPETIKAILDSMNKIKAENDQKLKDLQNQQGNDTGLPEAVLTNIERIAYALLQAMLKTNKISLEDYNKKLAELTKGLEGQTPPPSDLMGSESNNNFDFELQKKTAEMLERQKLLEQQAIKLEELKKKQELLEEQKRKQAEALQKQALDRYLNSLTPEERQKYLDRQNQLQDKEEPNNTVPTPTRTPTPTPNPNPPSWSDVEAPFEINLVMDGASQPLGYSPYGDEMSFVLDQITHTSDSKLTLQASNYTISEVKLNGEDWQLNGDVYEYTLPDYAYAFEFIITVNMSSTVYGNGVFTISGQANHQVTWNDFTLPFTLQLAYEGEDEENELELSYDASTSSYKLAQPIELTGEALLQLIPKFQDELTIDYVKFNYEERPYDEGEEIYSFFPESSKYMISYRVTHAELGSKVFIVNLDFSQDPQSWQDVQQPFEISYTYDSEEVNIPYQFYAYENEGWSGDLFFDYVYPIKDETAITLTAIEGYTITSVIVNEEPLANSPVFTLPLVEGDNNLTIHLYHEQFGPLTLNSMLTFVPDSYYPIQILKGNSSLEISEYKNQLYLKNPDVEEATVYISLPTEYFREPEYLTYYIKAKHEEFVSLKKVYEGDQLLVEPDEDGNYLIAIDNLFAPFHLELETQDPDTLEKTLYVINFNPN